MFYKKGFQGLVLLAFFPQIYAVNTPSEDEAAPVGPMTYWADNSCTGKHKSSLPIGAIKEKFFHYGIQEAIQFGKDGADAVYNVKKPGYETPKMYFEKMWAANTGNTVILANVLGTYREIEMLKETDDHDKSNIRIYCDDDANEIDNKKEKRSGDHAPRWTIMSDEDAKAEEKKELEIWQEEFDKEEKKYADKHINFEERKKELEDTKPHISGQDNHQRIDPWWEDKANGIKSNQHPLCKESTEEEAYEWGMELSLANLYPLIMRTTAKEQAQHRATITICDKLFDTQDRKQGEYVVSDLAHMDPSKKSKALEAMTSDYLYQLISRNIFHELLHFKYPPQQTEILDQKLSDGREAYGWKRALQVPKKLRRLNVDNYSYFAVLISLLEMGYEVKEEGFEEGKLVQVEGAKWEPLNARGAGVPVNRRGGKQRRARREVQDDSVR